MTSSDPRDLVRTLIRYAADFHQRGWMWGTSGNLSAKLSASPLAIAITGSGASKGELTLTDIAIAPEEARSAVPDLPACRGQASAETAIHLAVYRSRPDAGAVFHIHTVASTALSLAHAPGLAAPGEVEVTGLEMLKGWNTPWQVGGLRALIPVLPNLESMDALAREFTRLFAQGTTVPCILVAGHGMTVWGRTPEEARNRLEIAEFICQVLWQQRLAKGR